MASKNRNKEETKKTIGEVNYYERAELNGFKRFAIQTHFVKPNEDMIELINKYVKPLYQEGDVLSITAKLMCLTTGNVVYAKDMKVTFWAKLLSKFASHSPYGVGVDVPLKMQLVINICGLPRVLYAAFISAVTKLFGKKGKFYEICGHNVDGIDGFYPGSAFEEYHTMAMVNPENCDELCEEIYQKTGIVSVCMDANDFEKHQLGHCVNFPLTDEQMQLAMADNPSGQSNECTPFILIRKI